MKFYYCKLCIQMRAKLKLKPLYVLFVALTSHIKVVLQVTYFQSLIGKYFDANL